jgi:hypothetical protein
VPRLELIAAVTGLAINAACRGKIPISMYASPKPYASSDDCLKAEGAAIARLVSRLNPPQHK